jgi:hypothetical protein
MTSAIKKILFICGTRNTTTQMHRIAEQLPEYDHGFTNYYADGFLEFARRRGWLESSIVGDRARDRCFAYFREHGLTIDSRGARGGYQLVVTTHDAVLPHNIHGTPIVMVQEGLTDPLGLGYHLCKHLSFVPRWVAVTQATGLSNQFERFCVASEGYRRFFLRKGVRADKIVVTGIPNFDDCAAYCDNDFPHRGFVLVCTSDLRECLKWDDRPAFLRRAREIAAGRQLVFKLHPNENVDRAKREIARWAPQALVYTEGCAEHMIANCDVLVTQWSSTAYVGLALGKEVHSYCDLDELRELLPLQNRSAARNVAAVCREVLEGRAAPAVQPAAPGGGGRRRWRDADAGHAMGQQQGPS